MNDPGLPSALIDRLAQSPIVLVDVGARGGLQSRWKPAASALTWVGFEPDPRSWDGIELSELPERHHLLRTALSEAAGFVTFHRTRGEGESSILRPNTPFLKQFGRPERFDVVETVELAVDTLDARLTALGLRADVIKLDTQGSELAILKGAASTLAAGVIAVDVEVEFSQMYEDQPLFGDVDAYLRPFGLQLFDVSPRRFPYHAGSTLHLARGPVVWAETIYLRTADAIRRDITMADAGLGLSHLAKAVTVALLYGFPDFALALIAECAGVVATEHAAQLETAVREWDSVTQVPAVPWSVELTPAQIRGLQRIRDHEGPTPTAQLRKAVRAWLESHDI